jgi:hypothetical protein
MKSLMWVVAIAAIAALAYGIVSWRRRHAEIERAAEQRSAAFMAEMVAATRAKSATPADTAAVAALAKQKLLFEAAAKAGEAGEPVLAIQLYARLLARFPDTALAAQAREAVEAQKRNLAKP